MKVRKNFGLPPGAVMYTGSDRNVDVKVSYIEFNQESLKEEYSESAKKVILHPSIPNIIQWYDIRGLQDENLIKSISERFSMHPLAIEDATDVYQRPTFIEYANGLYVALKSIKFNQDTLKVEKQALSIYFGQGFVISFQEYSDDAFDGIRKRLILSKGKVRTRNSDYLAYALIDFVVDNYFTVIDDIEEHVESIEQSIHSDPSEDEKAKIYNFKKEVLKIRKSIAPLREAINSFSRSDSELIDPRTTTYIRDVYDHTIQIIDSIDSLRDILSGLQDLYISEISLKMNRIMQFLTIITAVFVPLSFLAGLYGMNFKYIPELEYRNGYFVLIVVMILLAIGMLFLFKKKKWL